MIFGKNLAAQLMTRTVAIAISAVTAAAAISQTPAMAKTIPSQNSHPQTFGRLITLQANCFSAPLGIGLYNTQQTQITLANGLQQNAVLATTEKKGQCPAPKPVTPPKPVVKPVVKHTAPRIAYYSQPVAPTHSYTPPAPSSGGSGGSSGSGVAYTDWAAEPCHSNVYAVGAIYSWKIPPGCYAGIYTVNPANFVYRSGYGWCNWWPEVLHPNDPRILFGARHSAPLPGAVVVFAPGVQGASAGGHYGEVVAVLGGGWILISEMNDSWRGGGFARINYRYVYLEPGVSFIYS